MIHDQVHELRRIIEDMFERFALSPKEVSRQRSVAVYAMLTRERLLRARVTVSGSIRKALENGGARS